MLIEKIHARQILDSRGNPTVEVDLHTGKYFGRAAVPSGASTGSHEAHELRDGGKKYKGKGVMKAVDNVNTRLSKILRGMHVDDQRRIDETMIMYDGTPNKSSIGANAMLGVSMAAARAGAMSYKMPLYEYIGALYRNNKYSMPIPFANVINGGLHAGTELKFQEFMVVPLKAKSFAEATMIISEIYHELKHVIAITFGPTATNIGDEGGFAPPITTPEQALKLLEIAAERTGNSRKVAFAIDAAASEFYDRRKDKYILSPHKMMRGDDLVDYYVHLAKHHRIISIEDPFHEEDYHSFAELNAAMKGKLQIVGDDLTVSNSKRIEKAADLDACNALLLKVNQVGTLTEALEAAHLARSKGWKVMVSHRSGETEDSFIADLAVGINSGMIKLGAPARGERTAKYNQLLRIEEMLGKSAKYAKFPKF